MIVVYIFFWILFVYLATGTVYLLALAIAGKWGKLPVYTNDSHKKRIAVIIPSYREDAIITDTARKAAAHNYPADKFTVCVVADSLQPETIIALQQIPVKVLEVKLSMKSKSVNAILHALDEKEYDIAMILDADNIMANNCLEKVNDAFNKGCRAMQCHRTAKNQHTPVAVLDAISEEINVNIFRRAPAVLGVSAAPIGSGMAFSFSLLKEIFSQPAILNNPGEDREIDLYLMKHQIPMHFIDGAYVYDEKVANAGVFEKQRVRWLEAQINHVKRFFDADIKTAPRTFTYFNKLYQNLLLPRSLFLLVYIFLFFLLVIQWAVHRTLLQPPPVWWLLLMLLYAASLLISVPLRLYNITTAKAILQIPVLMLSMVKALFKVKSGRKEFLHTPKTFKD
jgi:cellulose synthase/poly-beta-1,6-N-acetylglucosamine synthase-like glycosyltransferase